MTDKNDAATTWEREYKNLPEADRENHGEGGPIMSRRRMMVATGATAVAIGGAGLASAADVSVDHSSEYVADPYISANVSIAKHKADYSSALELEDDDGNDVELPAVLDDRDPSDQDETTRNLYGVRADRVDAADYHQFPRGETYDDDNDSDTDEVDVLAVDATHWAVDEANTAGTMTVEDGDDDVNSLRVSTSSIAAGEFATATFSDFSITSDEDKRHLQLAVNVDALSADSVVEIRAVDEDGDYKAATIDSSADSEADSTIATATGSGIVYQVQFADLAIAGSGDGSFNNIESVEIEVQEADATVEFFGIDVERKSRWVYGETVLNENTDDEETVTVREPEGLTWYTSLDGDLLAGSDIHDLEIPVKYTASAADAGEASESDAESYPSFDTKLKQLERISTKAAIDLSHSDLAIELDQSLPSDRFQALELAENTEDIDDEEDMTWSDVSGSLKGSGETALLEDLVESGTEYAIRVRTLLTADEFDAATSSGGAGGGARSTGGGFLSSTRGLLSSVLLGVLGFLGLRRFAGGD